jgi:hypothetical protein
MVQPGRYQGAESMKLNTFEQKKQQMIAVCNADRSYVGDCPLLQCYLYWDGCLWTDYSVFPDQPLPTNDGYEYILIWDRCME